MGDEGEEWLSLNPEILPGFLDYGDVADLAGPFLPIRPGLRILDAGAGSRTHLHIPEDAHLTAIDVSAEQLAGNTRADTKLTADVQYHDLAEAEFDLIVLWDVLEHLARPARTVRGLRGHLRPGGVMVIVGPVTASLKGRLTRSTPYWLHRFVYSHVLASRGPGTGPFRTHLRRGSRDDVLVALLQRQGIQIERWTRFDSAMMGAIKRRRPFLYAAYRLAARSTERLSSGRIPVTADFVLVARAPTRSEPGYVREPPSAPRR